MALTATALSAAVFADLISSISTVVNATRSNSTMNIMAHNPAESMVSACCSGWLDVVTKPSLIKDNYTGVAGASMAAPTTVKFANSAGAAASFQTAMGWKGSKGTAFAQTLVLSVGNQTEKMGQLMMNPPIGGGAGAGVVSPGINSSLTSMSTTFNGALTTAFIDEGNFFASDVGPLLTPEIVELITNLSTAYGMMLASITGAVTYAGSVSQAPSVSVNTGTLS